MRSVEVLGTHVTAAPLEAVAEVLESWVQSRRREFVCLANVHVVDAARRDPSLAESLRAAGMVLPDGAPVAWAVAGLTGRSTPRISGSDLFDELCRRSVARGYRHFFLGSTPETLARLAERVRARHPGIAVCGGYSPPFGPDALTRIDAEVAAVNAASPDIVWVGLGAPKQELWMRRVRSELEAPLLVGVGAVFDFASGTKRRAPRWAQRAGLEWAHRLVHEPRRLWRRYLVSNTLFVLGLIRALALSSHQREAHGYR